MKWKDGAVQWKSSVNFIKMTQPQPQQKTKNSNFRLRNSPNLREIVKHIRFRAENSWRLVSPILVCLPKTALFRQLTCNNFVLFTVGILVYWQMTKDLIMGKTMKSFLKNYTRRFFPGPGLVRHFDDSATLVRTKPP